MGGQCISSDATLPGFGGGEGQRYGSEVDGLIHRLPHALKTALPGAEIRASERGCAQRTSAHRIAWASRPRESGRQALLVRTCPQANTRGSTSRRQRDRIRAALCNHVWATGCAVQSRRGSGRAVQSRRGSSRAVQSRLGDGPPDCGGVPNGSSAVRRRRVPCGWIHCEIRRWIAADPPAGDASLQMRNTSNDKSVKVSTSYFKIEVSWR